MVDNDSVVYVNFLQTQSSENREEALENSRLENASTCIGESIISIHDYEKNKIINELIERANKLTW